MKNIKTAIIGLLVGVFFLPAANAQYFGRNKARYEKFDFKVLETPHFEMYHYLEDEEVRNQLAEWSEKWHDMHQCILHDTLPGKNPLIYYNDHADFQQTNAISGAVGIGTGGVTEALKNRVILPIAMSNQQTDHVIGHEMVHAFQYNMILNGDSTNLQSLSNLPLWMVEGLAEYMSIGRIDAHTSMWMRDAVLNDDVPTLKDLNNYGKYFPYRWGQVFWAFVTGLKGDDIIAPYFEATAKYGLDKATLEVLGMSSENLSEIWVSALKNHYGKFLREGKENFIGKKILSAENAGDMNIAPVISPNGRYVIFLSTKNLFTTDLFLADARTGKILRTVASQTRDGHIDDFSYIESAGTWSPDSKTFAFVGVKKGRNVLIIKDVLTGKTTEEFFPDGVPAFSNPAWSPDGKTIVVSGLAGGQHDLYSVNLRSKRVTQLTDDRYSEITPAWSFDGSRIVFATDRGVIKEDGKNTPWRFNLAVLTLETGAVQSLDLFAGADNMNPVFDNADNILFLSNRDGYRNMYRYNPVADSVEQMTDLLTGISGITAFAPAISVTRSDKRNRIVFTHFYDGKYSIHSALDDRFDPVAVSKDSIDLTAATLLRVNRRAPDMVDAALAAMGTADGVNPDALREAAYKPKFQLDYVGGGAGVGVNTGNTFGTRTGAAGGVDMLFSDILGNNQVFTSVALNGQLQDIGGAVAYINRDNKVAWGGSLSHQARRSGYLADRFYRPSSQQAYGQRLDSLSFYNVRLFQEQASVFAQLPFSKTLRIEGGGSYSFYSTGVEQQDNYYLGANTGFPRQVAQERTKIKDEADKNRVSRELGFNPFLRADLFGLNVALVGDNSYFGVAAPLKGHRFRLGIEQSFNGFTYDAEAGTPSYNFMTVTADFRKYVHTKPVTFAGRLMHVGRYGQGANTFFPEYLGRPWLVRGYEYGKVSEILTNNGRSVNDLLGSKLLVANFEMRLPFTGPEKLALFKNKFLFSDLNLFADGGLAWSEFSQFGKEGETLLAPQPIFSAGISARVNLFNAIIIEPYYAFPLQKGTRGVFGLNFTPGW